MTGNIINVSFETEVFYLDGKGDTRFNVMAVNLPEGKKILAMCEWPDDNDIEEYGYFALKNAIIDACARVEIDSSSLSFWYDGQEQSLSEDASANVEVSVDMNFD